MALDSLLSIPQPGVKPLTAPFSLPLQRGPSVTPATVLAGNLQPHPAVKETEWMWLPEATGLLAPLLPRVSLQEPQD